MVGLQPDVLCWSFLVPPCLHGTDLVVHATLFDHKLSIMFIGFGVYESKFVLLLNVGLTSSVLLALSLWVIVVGCCCCWILLMWLVGVDYCFS